MPTFNSQHNVDVLIRGRDQFSGEMTKVQATAERHFKGTGGIAQMAQGAAAAFAALVYSIRLYAQHVQKLEEGARRLGTTVEEFQRLRYVSQQTEAPLELLAGLMARMTRRAEEDSASLRALGITFDELQNSDPSVVLERTLRALEAMGSRQERDRVTLDLFRMSYSKLTQTIGASADEISKLRSQAPIISPNVAKDMDTVTDAMERMRAKAAALLGTLMDWRQTDKQFWESIVRIFKGGEAAAPGLPPGYKPGFNVPTLVGGPYEPFDWDKAAPSPPNMLDSYQPYREWARKAIERQGVIESKRGFDQPRMEMEPILEAQDEVRQSFDDLIDKEIQFRREIEETDRSGEQMGATLVATAFDFADATAQALANAIVFHENFAQSMKQIWKSMIAFLMGELLRLIYRQIVAATLQEVLFPGSTARATRAISGVTSGLTSGGGGPAGMESPQSSGAYRLPRTSQSGTVVINARTTLGSRNEARQLAATIAGYIAEVQRT